MSRGGLLVTALRWLAPLGCMAVLGGCFTVGPDYAPPAPSALQVPDSWQGALAPNEHGPELSSWWEQLGDELLIRLIDQALEASPDVDSARARLREARARRKLAGAELWPTLGASASAQPWELAEDTGESDAAQGAFGATLESRDLYEIGFDASWEPDIVGGKRRAREAANAELEASEAELSEAQVTLASEVARNYVEARSFQAQIAIAAENLESQSQTLELTAWRVQAGLASAVDAEQASTNVERTRASIPPLETSFAEAQHRLAILLGLAPAALRGELAPSAPIPQVPDPLTIGIPADVLRQRPDVAAAERTLAAETARIGEATAARYPTLSLSGSIGLEALALGALTQGSSLAATVGGSLAQTIFDGGRIAARIEIQDAVQERALVAYRSTVLAALEDVENALVALANHRARTAALASASGTARNAARLARQRYAAGIIDFQTVLDTERTVFTVDESRVAAQADCATAGIRLYKALGGGWGTRAGRPGKSS